METNVARKNRDVIAIKRTVWSNYDKFRTLGVFYLERNEVLSHIISLPDGEIARIAAECREGGVRWRNFLKYLNKVESSIVGGREITDASQTDALAIDSIGGMAVSDFFKLRETADGARVSFNVNGKFDVLAKGNRNGVFNARGLTVTPETEFTAVNELTAFWEDRYSIALKGEDFSVAISAEDTKTGKKGSACIRVYLMTEDRIVIDDLGKYMDTDALTQWITA